MKFAFFTLIFYFVVSIHTANNFQFMYSQKILSKASLLISNKYFQRPIFYVLSGITEKYSTTVNTAVQLLE